MDISPNSLKFARMIAKRIGISADFIESDILDVKDRVKDKFDDMGDYTCPDRKVHMKSYEWNWTLGEVISAFCEAEMRIDFLHEFPQYFYNGYTVFDVETDKVELYPCTFTLKATAT